MKKKGAPENPVWKGKEGNARAPPFHLLNNTWTSKWVGGICMSAHHSTNPHFEDKVLFPTNLAQ